MSLLGTAAMVAWHNLESGREAEHDCWHSREHLSERVGIEGFRRGRRGVAGDSAARERYFLMYEVDDLSVLTSEAYLDRLNHPSPWSQQVIPTICDMTRTLCRVRASIGDGVGGWVSTLRFGVSTEHRERLIQAAVDSIVRSLTKEEGVIAAHLLEGDKEGSGLKTEEKRLRGVSDAVADLVLMTEGYDEASVRASLIAETLESRLRELGVDGELILGVYQTRHVVSEADLANG